MNLLKIFAYGQRFAVYVIVEVRFWTGTGEFTCPGFGFVAG